MYNQRPIVIRQEKKLGPFGACCSFGCLGLLFLFVVSSCASMLGFAG